MKDVEPTTSMREADVIFPDFGPTPYTGEVGAMADAITREAWFKLYSKKIVWVTLCDFPVFSQKVEDGLKFVLSPLPDRQKNLEYHVHAMPIHPCQGDYIIQMDRDYTIECRQRQKKWDFAFIGNVTGGIPNRFFEGRRWLKELHEKNLNGRMYLRDNPGWAFNEHWEADHREWMQRIAEAKYGFAPAGASNGPRGYWTMQVGTVPVFTNIELLPFDTEINWSDAAVIVPKGEALSFKYEDLPVDAEYTRLRMNAIKLWDEYCWMPNLAKRMGKIIREHVCEFA
jgi:hypothetical protein